MEKEEIQKALEENRNIQPRIKNTVIEVFSDIYDFLGERGLKKWLLDNHFNSLARKVVIKVMTSRTNKHLKRNPTVKGYYKIEEGKKPKIVLRKKVGENKPDTGHEVFHMLGNGLGGFNIFFGEGITEFLSKTLYKNEFKYSYRRNVDVVSLLYAMYSNRLLKYYFTTQGSQFFYDLAKETNGEKQKKMIENLDKIEIHFTNYHMIKYRGLDNKDPEIELKEGIDSLLENYWLYKEDQIQKFRYIKDGKVDFDSFIKEMAGVYSCYLRLYDLTRTIEEKGGLVFLNNLDHLIDELLTNSHLLVGLDPDTQQSVKQNIGKQISSEIVNNSFKYKYGKIPDVIMDQEDEPYRSLNENAKEKLLEKFVKNKRSEDIFEQLEVISNIARATNMTQDEIEDAIRTVSLDNIRIKPNQAMNLARKYNMASSNLHAIEEYNRQNMLSPRYIQIDLDFEEQRRGFIEINVDNKEMSLLLLADSTGRMDKVSLEKFGTVLPDQGLIIKRCINKDELPENVKGMDRVYKVFSAEGKQTTFIGISDKFLENSLEESFKIVNGNIYNGFEYYNDMRESILSRILLDNMEFRKDNKESSQEDLLESTIRFTKRNMRTGIIQNQIQEIQQLIENEREDSNRQRGRN